LFALGAMLLGAIVILAVAAWILRPIRQILDTLQAVRRGDPAARVPVRAAGELGAMGNALNELIEAHAEWVEQESAERQQRESEVQELVSVLKGLACGDLSQRARVDGHLAGLANAVNAMGESVGHLTDRLCVVPPRVAETAYAMQTVADQVLQDTDRQTAELGSASTAAGEIVDWLHGCTIDAQGVIDAASRVEQVGRSLARSCGGTVGADEPENSRRPTEEWKDESAAAAPLQLTTVRYERLRATIDEGETLRGAIRTAMDAVRRIRTGAEALRGHAQTLQLIAMDLHTKGGAGSNGDLGTGGGDHLGPQSLAGPRV
jgi:methyl-accepting chemotaxis protein